MGLQWYEMVQADSPLDQGDMIRGCPALVWRDAPRSAQPSPGDGEALTTYAAVDAADMVVMTQTCDLAQNKVSSVVLCPHCGLDLYKEVWEATLRAHGQSPTTRAWTAHLDHIAAGRIWNLAMLNSEEGSDYSTELRIVDFHEVFSLPRGFIEAWLVEGGEPRLRLRPPYREHLSQAFARFFMRVGLPTDIHKTW